MDSSTVHRAKSLCMYPKKNTINASFIRLLTESLTPQEGGVYGNEVAGPDLYSARASIIVQRLNG